MPETNTELSSKLSILLAFSNSEELSQIKSTFQYEKDVFVEDALSDGFLLNDKIKSLTPDVLMLDYHLRNINMGDFLEEATIRYPTTIIVLIVNETDLVDLKKLISVSIRNIVTRPLNFAQLPNLIRGFFIASFKDKKNQVLDISERKPGMMVAITGSKGGVGKSILSANLSLVLSNLAEKYKVLCIDYCIPYGDQKAILGIFPEKSQSILDLITIADELTLDKIKSVVVQSQYYPHFDVLLSPNKPIDMNTIKTSAIKRIFRALRLYYDFIVIDMNPYFDELNKVVYEKAEKILILFTPEIHSIYRLVNQLKEFQWMKIKAPPEIIYNRRSKKTDQSVASLLSRVLPYPVFTSITDDPKNLQLSLNQLYPVVTKKIPIRQDIMAIARKIVEWYLEI